MEVVAFLHLGAPTCQHIDSCAADAGVLAMTAVVGSPPSERTIRNARLYTGACYVVHPYRTAPAAELLHLSALGAPHRRTHDLRVHVAPAVVADRTPFFGVEHFNTAAAIAFAACDETHVLVGPLRWNCNRD